MVSPELVRVLDRLRIEPSDLLAATCAHGRRAAREHDRRFEPNFQSGPDERLPELPRRAALDP
jgi:hypothetical protein